MMGHVPAIPESTRDSITWRLILHAEKNWPQLDKVQVTSRGGFAYAAGVLPGGEKIPRSGSATAAPRTPSASRSTPPPANATTCSLLLTGHPTGTPQEALDTACTIHLAGISHEPSTNLRSYP